MAKKKGKKLAKVKVKEVKGQLGKKKETAREKMIGQSIGYRYDVNLLPDYSKLTPFLKKYIESKCNKEICLYSAGTDGIDGPTDAAGAIVDSAAIDAYASSNLDLDDYLLNNDSYTFFNRINSLIITGATGTNVADIQITIIK